MWDVAIVVYSDYMKRESLIFFLGFVIFVMPFLGLPSTWKRVIYMVCGLVLVLVGYHLRRLAYLRSIGNDAGERATDVYVEQVSPPVASAIPPDFSMPEAREASDLHASTTELRPRRKKKKKV